MIKVEFENSRGLNLVGNLYSVDSDLIIIFSHGWISNKDSKGRFPLLAKALNNCGYDILTFDFSGCGESDNDICTTEKRIDDLKSAIKFIKSKGYKKIALYGHSFGSYISLLSYNKDISAIALSGALTDSMNYNWEEYLDENQLNDLNNKGYFIENVNEIQRKSVVVDNSMLLDFQSINQEKLLKNITCPVIIIHGDNDDEEVQLCKRSKNAMNYLKNSDIVVIHGENHSFINHYDKLVEIITKWFLKHFK